MGTPACMHNPECGMTGGARKYISLQDVTRRYLELRRLERQAQHAYHLAHRMILAAPGIQDFTENMKQAVRLGWLRRREERWNRLAVKMWNEGCRIRRGTP